MDSLGKDSRPSHRAAFATVILVVLFALTTTTDARTRRREKPSAFKVALEPFAMVHSAVHAVAAPIVHNVPRLALRAATEPIRIAYHASLDRRPEPRRSRSGDDDDYDEVPRALPDYTPRRALLVEPAENEPMQVAYVVPHATSALPPRTAEPEDQDDDVDSADVQDEPRDEEPSGWEPAGSKPMVNGSRAVLRRGIASAPSQAPQAVKNAIWAANTLRNKPYIWGGGHGSFYDRGYDCSGTVSFALHGAGAIGSPIPSTDLRRYGERGRGRWFTIYSRNGHTFAVIAGLRLDTTDFQNGGNSGPRWHADIRDTGGYVARHPAGM